MAGKARLVLPARPESLRATPVALWREAVRIETYQPLPPTPYPMFLESRVYQGSSGRVYPLPFYERIAAECRPRMWDAVHLENQWIRLMVLPELGGRIHVGLDRSNGYDFFYRQNVIKPALVGLAGPWISGGVEFNWPQHHRPATFLPVDVRLGHGDDGSATVWCSDHDPMARMKGMHGITLHPDRSVVELSVRLYNRTDEVQTFLWWANAGVRVNDGYQAFFPTDVVAVADHAKRATTTFPRASGRYYGVDYPGRVSPANPDADRLDWYRNIPVPTSYMVISSQEDFFGGYDHEAGAGLVHWADHHIAPGKKLWTWGNHPFGHTWNDNLTDGDGPYIELMAGVYTDNQPDFSFLAPGETKSFRQYWLPVAGTGPVHAATPEAAAHVAVEPSPDGGTHVQVALAVTSPRPGAAIRLRHAADGRLLAQWQAEASPGSAVRESVALPESLSAHEVALEVEHDGQQLLRCVRPSPPAGAPAAATEPPDPGSITSSEELFLTGLHLRQYRHPTRAPEPYWQEAVRRDPGDSRSHLALATAHYGRAEYETALRHARAAVARLTMLNPNPYDGEAHYRLGAVLRALGLDESYDAFSKATWNAAWRAPASFALAQLDSRRQDWSRAVDHLGRCLTAETDHLRARDLLVLGLRRLGRTGEAESVLEQTLALDPLDWWASDIGARPLTCDSQTHIDVALEYAAGGFAAEALDVLSRAVPVAQGESFTGTLPLIHYHRAALLDEVGDGEAAVRARAMARQSDLRYCFPARLADEQVLRAALGADDQDHPAGELLALWLYDRRRHPDAIAIWRRITAGGAPSQFVLRNLAIGLFNVEGAAEEAMTCYDRAVALAPTDGRLRYERDQLASRMGVMPAERLTALRECLDVVAERDDLTIEAVHVFNTVGEPERALELLLPRRFQPWEGGEGRALAAWERTRLLLARGALADGHPPAAEAHVKAALEPPASLGEARHPLANCAHLWLCLGDVLRALDDDAGALAAWRAAAEAEADFREMAVQPFSEMTYFSVVARHRLGDHKGADRLAGALDDHARELARGPATIDYFATSLPQLLLFSEDPQRRQEEHVELLLAQVALLRHQEAEARRRLDRLLAANPSHPVAVDLRSAIGSGRDA